MKKSSVVLMSVIMLMVLTLVTACGSKEKVSLGAVEGNSYKNDFFGLSVDIPKGWNVADTATLNQLTEEGKEAIAGGDEKKKKQLDLAEEKSLNLLMISKLPMSQQGQKNPNVLANAEKLSFLQNVKSGKDYLKSAQKMMKDAKLPYEFGEIVSAKLGGKEFDVMEATLKPGDGSKITQFYYTTIMKGYAFNFIVTYYDDASKAETDLVTKSISFK